MAGSSDQEKAVKRQLESQKGFQDSVESGKFNVTNPFDDFKPQFDYSDMEANLNKIFEGQSDILTKSTSDAVATGQKDAVSSLASRGITGGSAVDTVTSGVASDVNKSKTNALTQLGIGKAGSIADLMKYFTQLDLTKIGSGANIDLANQGNLLSGLQGSFGNQASLMRGLDDTTWLDDALGIVKTGTNAASAIAGIPGI